MKKLLYFTSRDMTSAGQGINRKITQQIDTFRKSGFQVDAVYRKDVHKLVVHNGSEEILISDKLKAPYKIASSKYLRYFLKDKQYDAAYIRYVFDDYQFHKLLKLLHSKNISVVVEIPTYPYDAEFHDSLENKIVLCLDKIYRKYLQKYVQRIATFSKDEKIWGVPTIQIMNGVDFSKIRPRICDTEHNSNGDINIIAVADLAKWHGYDRVLNGLGQYYKEKPERNITFHLVGSGAELENYKKLVEEWNIEDQVIFYGRLQGEQLDRVYDKCNLAAECFGAHRKDAKLSSSLKSREYIAKGLPIISSIDIDVFLNQTSPYFYKFEDNELPIDMNRVIEFFDSVYGIKTQEEVARELRDYGEKICDIGVTLQPVVNYFNDDNIKR